MQQYLPYDGFEWIDELKRINFNIPDDDPVVYILEVNFKYLEHLHDAHKDLPFCPEHKKPPDSSQTKLVTTVEQKSRYILHYRNLKHALANGLKLTIIHRVLKFNHRPWLKEYIDLNSRMRQAVKNDFEKNLDKFMNNAILERLCKMCEKELMLNY